MPELEGNFCTGPAYTQGSAGLFKLGRDKEDIVMGMEAQAAHMEAFKATYTSEKAIF